MDNFVNLIQHLVYLSTVMMENGEGSVPQTVSGRILICQWRSVQNWATVNLVNQLLNFLYGYKLTWLFILESTTIQTICRNPNPPIKVFILSDCKEPGLTNCTVASSDNCVTSCFIVSLQTCNTG